LFKVGSLGASNTQITALVTEMFEDICGVLEGATDGTYARLIEKVLPSLIGAFNAFSDTAEDNPLTNVS